MLTGEAWVELGWKLVLIKSPALCSSAHDVSRTVPQCRRAAEWAFAPERFTFEAAAKEHKRKVVSDPKIRHQVYLDLIKTIV